MDKLYNAKETCLLLGVSNPTLWRYTKKGYIRAVKFPGKSKNTPIRWEQKEIEKFLKKYRFLPSDN